MADTWHDLARCLENTQPPPDLRRRVDERAARLEQPVTRERVPRAARWVATAAFGILILIALGIAAHSRATQPGNEGSKSPVPVPSDRVFTGLVYATPADGSPFANREIIYRSSPNGGDPVKLAIGADPAISPDGRWVAYHDGTVGVAGALKVVSTTGGFPTSFGATTGEPVAWSADSQRLAATDSRGVAIVDVRSHKTSVIALPTNSSQFSFAPDGSALVFQRATFHGIYIYTVSTSGGAPHRLTSDGRSGSPLWGRDGVAFWRYGSDARGHPCPSCFGDVWMMSGNGSDAHQITHTGAGIMPIAWSADGSRLLAAVPARHNGKLYAVDLAKGRTYALTDMVGDLFAQGLSRDGRTVLAAIGCGGMPTLTGLVETIPFNGGEPTVIVHGPCRASWNA